MDSHATDDSKPTYASVASASDVNVHSQKEANDQVAAVEDFDPDEKPSLCIRRKFLCVAASIFIAVIAVTVGVTLGFPTFSPTTVVTSAPTDFPTFSPTTVVTSAPTDFPTFSPISPTFSPTTVRFNLMKQRIVEMSPDIEDESSDSFKALNWIVNEDERQVETSDSSIIQRYVLAKTYYSTKGFNWDSCSYNRTEPYCTYLEGGSITYSVFLSEKSECDWYGVKCNDDGEISELLIALNNLEGTLPDEIGELSKHLRTLDLGFNFLTGTIPSSFGGMTKLGRLHLYGNELTGTIPSSLSKMTGLKIIGLSRNKLTGTLPSELGALTGLQQLSFSRNKLTGTIPPSYGSLKNLEFLFFRFNQLSGTMPPSICNLTDIKLNDLNADCLEDSDEPPLITCDCCHLCCGSETCEWQ